MLNLLSFKQFSMATNIPDPSNPLNRMFITILCIVFICIVGTSCNPPPQKSYSDQSYEYVVDTDPEKPSDRKLIKKGQIRGETNNISQAKDFIESITPTYDGYFTEEHESSYDTYIQQEFTIKVPTHTFDSLVDEITAYLKIVEYKHITVADVTEEFIDIQARLKTKKEFESRYVDLLSQANNVTEILAIEEQLAKQREEIESVEGRMKYLQNQIDLATLQITIYQAQSKKFLFEEKVLSGFSKGWSYFLSFLIGLVNIWPFIILLSLLILFRRKIVTSLWQKRKTNDQV